MSGAISEYRFFLTEYLLPLMGIPRGTVNLEPVDSIQRCNTFNVMRRDRIIYFLADKVPYFKAEISITDDNIRLARNIISSFSKVSRYKLLDKGTSVQHEYLSDELLKKSYEYAIQHGICSWITGNTQNIAINRLLNILERWSVQTYEGKKLHSDL